MTRIRTPVSFILGATLLVTPVCGEPIDREAGIRAGAAERDISPPVGMEILHYFRKNAGVHGPLFLRALVLEDAGGTSFALVTADLICAGFSASDELRARVKEKTGVGSRTKLPSNPPPERARTSTLQRRQLSYGSEQHDANAHHDPVPAGRVDRTGRTR